MLIEKADYANAERHLAQALVMRRKLLGSEHADVAVTLVELGRVYEDLGSNERAEPLLREALAIRQKALGDDHRETAVSLNADRLGVAPAGRSRRRRVSSAAVPGGEPKTRGPDHPNSGMTLHDLGLIAATKGDLPSALSLFRQALEIHRKAYGDEHPTVAVALNSIARGFTSARATHRGGGCSAGGGSHGASDAGGRSSARRDLHINLASVQLARHEPASAEALLREAFGFAPERPAWFRAVGACSWKTIGVSAPRRACSAPHSPRSNATRKPRQCCSMHAAISQSVPAVRGVEMKDTITRLGRPLRRVGQDRERKGVSIAPRLLGTRSSTQLLSPLALLFRCFR